MDRYALIRVRIVDEGPTLTLVALPDPDGVGESLGWVDNNELLDYEEGI